MKRVVVTLTDPPGTQLHGRPHEMNEDQVRQQVEQLLGAESKGYLVLDTGGLDDDERWCAIPIRNVLYVTIEEYADEH